MFRKQYNNNLLFTALVVILLAVIVAFAYLIIKINHGNQNSADSAQNNSVENLETGSEVSTEILKSLNAPANTETKEDSDSSDGNKEVPGKEITPEILESLNAPAETASETNNSDKSSSSNGTIDPEILKSLNAPQ